MSSNYGIAQHDVRTAVKQKYIDAADTCIDAVDTSIDEVNNERDNNDRCSDHNLQIHTSSHLSGNLTSRNMGTNVILYDNNKNINENLTNKQMGIILWEHSNNDFLLIDEY